MKGSTLLFPDASDCLITAQPWDPRVGVVWFRQHAAMVFTADHTWVWVLAV